MSNAELRVKQFKKYIRQTYPSINIMKGTWKIIPGIDIWETVNPGQGMIENLSFITCNSSALIKF